MQREISYLRCTPSGLLGTPGTVGTDKNDVGLCVPIENPNAGNTGNKTGSAGADTTRCSRLFPACSRVLVAVSVNVYEAVPTVPTVPTQIAEVSKMLVKPRHPGAGPASCAAHVVNATDDFLIELPAGRLRRTHGFITSTGDRLYQSLTGNCIQHPAALEELSCWLLRPHPASEYIPLLPPVTLESCHAV